MKRPIINSWFHLYSRSLGLLFLLALAAPIQAALLVPTNSPNWRLFKGRTEASNPTTAWRFGNFNDSAFVTAPAPFWYGDTRPGGTQLTDMINSYTCFFLRHTFVVSNLSEISGIQSRFYIDDGFVMWINGIEVQRYAVSDPLTITTLAANQAVDPAVFEEVTLPTPVSNYLVNGTNYVCIQVFNTTLASSDIGFDIQLLSIAPDLVPPTVASQTPTPGVVNSLTSITVNFNEDVSGVDAGDLLINGTAAADVSGTGAAYTFTFPQPAYGTVNITWAANNNITDFGIPPNSFDGAAPGNLWQYTLVDNTPPVMATILPLTNSAVRTLQQVEITFSELVTGVDASDLLINGSPATSVANEGPGQYVFTFPQPTNGTVFVGWALDHGIQDRAAVPNNFAGGFWTYVLDPNAAFFDIRINEFMADNQNGIRDEDGTEQDWIELYNAASTAVDMSGWYLTDEPLNLTKWRFPNGVAMPANSYLLIWASGKNRTNIFALHSNFQLAKNGEYLGLVLPDGSNVVNQFTPTYPPQRTDVSYGRDRLDPSIVGFYNTPTPNAPNATGGPKGFASDVIYSRASGTFVTPFTLTLATVSSNAVIRYVAITNFSDASASVTNVPTTNSPIYSGPLAISITTQIRARAFEPGLLPSTPMTESYIQISTNVLNFSSDLPMCVVHNLGGGNPPAGGDMTGIFMIFDTNTTMRSSLTNAPRLATRMGFNRRGASTQDQAKSNFAIEFWDEFNQDINLPFLDMPADSDWVLYGINAFDQSQLHNAIFHWFGRQIGQPASRTRYIEVFRKIDGGPVTTNDYFGLYLVEEKPKQGKDRLDIADLELENTNAPSVTGGYMLKIDRSDPDERVWQPPQVGSIRTTPAQIVYVYPNVSPSTTDPRRLIQFNYIQSYILTFLTNLDSVSFTNTVTGYARYIDPDQWVDNLIGNIICFNVDGYRLSGYIYKDREDRLKQGPFWDCDRCMGTGGAPNNDNRCWSPRYWRLPANDVNTDNGTDFFGVSNIGVSWFARLFRDPDFWQRFIDRYQLFRTNEYSANAILAMIDGFYNEIKEAQVRDQARWAPSGFTYPRSGIVNINGYSFDFGPADNFGRGRFTNEISFQKKWFVDRLEFMDTNFLSMPTLSSGSALVPSGATVTATPALKANTLLLYTLDGTDPRLPGGAVAPFARTNSGALTLTITNNVRLFARSYNTSHANMTNSGTEVGKPLINSVWSAPAGATYYTALPPLRIAELMYNPFVAPGDTNDPGNFEYVELVNTSGSTLNLIGFQFTNGIEFKFTATNSVTSLATGGRVLVVKNRAAFLTRHPELASQVAGEYTGSLDNAGERIALIGPLGEPILDFKYDNQWYPATDGVGFSLVTINESAPAAAWTNASNWRASAVDGGSPGTADPAPASILPVVVNEVLSNPVLPGPDAIELFNPNPSAVNLGHWYLTDNRNLPQKYRIPADTSIPGNSYRVFYSTNSFSAPGVTNIYGDANGFRLSSFGEEVYLFSGDSAGHLTGYFQGFDFGPAPTNVTFGRYTNSAGTVMEVAQSATTLGSANAYPQVGPVVISEFMFYPPDLYFNGVLISNDRDEFIELRNITGSPVPLFDPDHPNNTWQLQKAVDFIFPMSVTLPGNGRVVIVGFDPRTDTNSASAFRNRYGLAVDTVLYGPYDGRLENDGERLELRRPGVPDPITGFAPMILADRVDYVGTNAPWDAARGTSASMQRKVHSDFGNDPGNWLAAGPNPSQDRVTGDPPTITQHPFPQDIVEESTATFSVTPGGTGPFTYQWYRNNVPIDGAFSATLVLPNVQLAQAGIYKVLVLSGNGAIFSSPALLTVLPLPVITQQPADQKVIPGTNVIISVGATGTGELSYQWLYNGANLSGETASTLTLNNVQLSQAGLYRVVVTDSIGTRASREALLYVLVKPTIVRQPGPTNQIVLAGEDTAISAEAAGAVPLDYRWRRNGTTYVSNGVATLTLTNVTLADAGYYDTVITNLAGGTTPQLSARAYVVVVDPPVSQGVMPGANVTFRAIVRTPGPLTNRFWWLYNGTNVLREGTNLVSASNPVSFTNDLALTGVTAGQAGSYTFLVSNVVVVVTTNLTSTNIYNYIATRAPTATLVVGDSTPPNITCPGNLAVNADPAQCTANPTYAPVATDNVGVAGTACAPAGPYPLGPTTVTCWAWDVSGNSNSCSFTITVADTQAPVVTGCPGPQTLTADQNGQAAVPDLRSLVTATDNCGTLTLTQAPAPGALVGGGTNMVTITVRDGSLNPATCQTAVIVEVPVTEIRLAIELAGTNAIIRWPDSTVSWTLQEASALTSPPNWQTSGAPRALLGGQWRATVPVAEGTNKFFQLKRP